MALLGHDERVGHQRPEPCERRLTVAVLGAVLGGMQNQHALRRQPRSELLEQAGPLVLVGCT